MLLLSIALRRLPIVLTWATKAKVELKQLLIPLSFAALLGGTNTIIGECGGFIHFWTGSRLFQHSRWCKEVEQAQWQNCSYSSGGQLWGVAQARRVPTACPCHRSPSPPLPGTSTNLVVTGQFDSRVLNPSSPYYIEGGPVAWLGMASSVQCCVPGCSVCRVPGRQHAPAAELAGHA